MRIDSNRAWQDATAAVAAKRELLLALAGVFTVLPAFAFALLYPQPEPPAGAGPEALMGMMGEYYKGAMLPMLLAGIFQIIGVLAMLALFTDRSRPTVGEALRQALGGTLPVIVAQLLMGLGIGAVALLLMIPVGLSKSVGLGLLVGLALIALITFVWVRTSLVAPAVVVDGLRNPIAALVRSWTLTAGNGWRLLGFYLLLVVVFVIGLLVVTGVLGLVFGLVAGADGARIGSALVSSAASGVMQIYMVAVSASVHRQLAGVSPEATASTFE